MRNSILNKLKSPILLQGNETTAYRDPAVIFYEGIFYLFCTLVETESDGNIFMYTVQSESCDLCNWSTPRKITERNNSKNFSGPGNVIQYNGQWYLCLQTYCRENGEKYGNDNCRIYVLTSDDLKTWQKPRLLKLKGEKVSFDEMGRMIDPFLVKDKFDLEKWWCFYKQNGVSLSYTYDFEYWSYYGNTKAGENVCVIESEDGYILFHSPENGVAKLYSKDLNHWTSDDELITLGQKYWPWAQGRLTAGFVLDCRSIKNVNKYLMFFHGTGPQDESVIFDTHACIGIAWSDNLIDWEYV